MPIGPPSKCDFPSCHELVPFGEGHYCPAHKGSMRQEAPRRNEPFYQSRAWRNVSQLHRRYNPVCQRLENGIQCTRPSKVVHHLQDPSNAPDLSMDWSNLVSVCAEHHAGGAPGAKDDEAYCDTYGVMDTVYPHGHGPASWKGTGRMIETAGAPPVEMHTGNIGAQNKALDGMDLDALLAVQLPGTKPTT